MPRMTREEARSILRQRPIFTKELTDAKGVLNRLFEKEHTDRVREPYFYGGAYENRTQDVQELDYLDWYGLHRVPGLVKRVNDCKQDQDPALCAMRAFLADWVEDAALVADARKAVTKGRRPSTAPRLTPERTLENTGTCPVCGRNVKLHYGRMYDHGFEIKQYGFRNGNCFGVNELPWEISKDGKVKYAKAINRRIAEIEEDIEFLQCEPDADPRQVQKDLVMAESELRFIRKTLDLVEEEIANWTLQKLPGEK